MPITSSVAYPVLSTEVNAGALGNAYSAFTLEFSMPRIYFDSIDLSWDSASADVATIDWYVTYDTTGDVIALPNKQSVAVVGQTANTGGVSETVERWLVLTETDFTLTVWVKTDAPTATIAMLRATYTG